MKWPRSQWSILRRWKYVYQSASTDASAQEKMLGSSPGVPEKYSLNHCLLWWWIRDKTCDFRCWNGANQLCDCICQGNPPVNWIIHWWFQQLSCVTWSRVTFIWFISYICKLCYKITENKTASIVSRSKSSIWKKRTLLFCFHVLERKKGKVNVLCSLILYVNSWQQRTQTQALLDCKQIFCETVDVFKLLNNHNNFLLSCKTQ